MKWLELELADLGVDVRTGVEADEASLAGADVVVLATGARPAPDRLGDLDGSIPVLSIDEAVAQQSFWATCSSSTFGATSRRRSARSTSPRTAPASRS